MEIKNNYYKLFIIIIFVDFLIMRLLKFVFFV